MTWRLTSTNRHTHAQTGYYIDYAFGAGGKPFYNAYTPTGKHVAAGYVLEKVQEACDRHAAKVSA